MQQVTIQSDRIIVTQRGGSTILLGKYAYACRYSTAGASPPGLEPLYYTVSVFFDEGKGPVNLDTGERQDEYVFDLRFVEKTSQPTWNNTEQGAENAVLAITPFLRAEECCPSGTPGAVIAVNQAQCWNLLDPTWGVQPEQLIDCVIPSIDFCDPEFLAALTEEQLVCIIPTCDPLTATLNGVEIINEADPCGAEITLDCDDPVNALVVESSGEPAETLLFVPGADLFGFHAWYPQPQLDPAFAIAWSVADEAWGIWNITGETFEAVSTGDQSSPITATWEGFTVRQATIGDLCCGEPVPCEDAIVTWDGEPLLTIPSGGTQDLDCNTLVNAAYAVDGGSVTGTYKPDGTLNSREVFRLDVSHNFEYTGTRWRLVKPGSDYDAALGSETKPWDADWSATPVTVTQATIGAYCDDCVPCEDANVEINGTAFDTVAAGGTLDVPVVNTAATPVGTVNAGVDVVVPDATYQLKDSAAGNIGSPGAIASGASANITAPDAAITVNSAAFGNALSNGTLDVPVKDGTGTAVGSKVGSDWIVPTAVPLCTQLGAVDAGDVEDDVYDCLTSASQEALGTFYYTTALCSDADAARYIATLQAKDGQMLEPAVRAAICDLFAGLKADGIYTALQASALLVGARTLNGCLTNLNGVNCPTNNNFVDADYNRKTGLVGDGATKFLMTNRNNAADAQNNQSAGVWANTAATVTGSATYYFGAGAADNGTTQMGRVATPGANLFARSQTATNNITSGTNVPQGAATGLIGLSRSGSATYTIRAASTDYVVTQASQAPLSRQMAVFAAQGSATAFGWTDARLQFYWQGSALNMALLESRINTYLTAIAAAIP